MRPWASCAVATPWVASVATAAGSGRAISRTAMCLLMTAPHRLIALTADRLMSSGDRLKSVPPTLRDFSTAVRRSHRRNLDAIPGRIKRRQEDERENGRHEQATHHRKGH